MRLQRVGFFKHCWERIAYGGGYCNFVFHLQLQNFSSTFGVRIADSMIQKTKCERGHGTGKFLELEDSKYLDMNL